MQLTGEIPVKARDGEECGVGNQLAETFMAGSSDGRCGPTGDEEIDR